MQENRPRYGCLAYHFVLPEFSGWLHLRLCGGETAKALVNSLQRGGYV